MRATPAGSPQARRKDAAESAIAAMTCSALPDCQNSVGCLNQPAIT